MLMTHSAINKTMQSVPAVAVGPDVVTASSSYASRFEGPIGAWLLKVQEEAILGMLRSWPGARVLEVGGAHGQLTGALIEAGHQVTVFGSPMCSTEHIQKYLDQGKCTFTGGDLTRLPYKDQAFDVVIVIRLLAHMKLWEAFLAELARVARKAVIVDYPSKHSLGGLFPSLFGVKQAIEGNARRFSVIKTGVLQATFEDFGFEAREIFRQFTLPMAVHRVLKRPRLSAAVERACRILGLTQRIGSPVIANFTRNADR